MIKTVSLETAKLLKEAGFPQETALFYRVDEFGNVFERNVNEDPLKMQKVLGTNIYYAKPTTDELLGELPEYIEDKIIQGKAVYLRIDLLPSNREFRVQYQRKFDEGSKIADRIPVNAICDKSLPEALAQMWLWLKKEGLLTGSPTNP